MSTFRAHSASLTRHLPAAIVALLLLVAAPAPAAAQMANAVGEELLGHFDTSMEKFIALARAMPAESYTWAPGEGVMEVGHVFMHVARYNYLYPVENMGAALPAGVTPATMEAVRDKEAVVRALEASQAFVKQFAATLDDAALRGSTTLYGRQVQHWQVLVQLVSHMNEHLGQSIAYARMNGVVPPWSR